MIRGILLAITVCVGAAALGFWGVFLSKHLVDPYDGAVWAASVLLIVGGIIGYVATGGSLW